MVFALKQRQSNKIRIKQLSKRYHPFHSKKFRPKLLLRVLSKGAYAISMLNLINDRPINSQIANPYQRKGWVPQSLLLLRTTLKYITSASGQRSLFQKKESIKIVRGIQITKEARPTKITFFKVTWKMGGGDLKISLIYIVCRLERGQQIDIYIFCIWGFSNKNRQQKILSMIIKLPYMYQQINFFSIDLPFLQQSP